MATHDRPAVPIEDEHEYSTLMATCATSSLTVAQL